MRAVLLIYCLGIMSASLAQNITYPLNNRHEGKYELEAYTREEYSVDLPGKGAWQIYRDTVMLDVEKTFRQYTGYKMAVWEPLKQHPFGNFRT